MIRELRHLWDVLRGRVELPAELRCARPWCGRTKSKVSHFEAHIFAAKGRLHCRCGSPMRPAPDTDHHISRAATYWAEQGQEP